MTVQSVGFTGVGLHSGARHRLTLARAMGPVRFDRSRDDIALAEMVVADTHRGVRLQDPQRGFAVELVEHLLAALAGLGIRRGLSLRLEAIDESSSAADAEGGGEIPILDGGARELAAALGALRLPRMPPTLRVVRAGEHQLGESRYRWTPGPTVQLDVSVEFPPLAPQQARWHGSAEDFLERIAPARSFGFERDAAELHARGRARGADPATLLILDDQGQALPPGEPMAEQELARHKLLDLMGDLYLYGGPPLGHLEAHRPGHGATHAVLKRALAEGVLALAGDAGPG